MSLLHDRLLLVENHVQNVVAGLQVTVVNPNGAAQLFHLVFCQTIGILLQHMAHIVTLDVDHFHIVAYGIKLFALILKQALSDLQLLVDMAMGKQHSAEDEHQK